MSEETEGIAPDLTTNLSEETEGIAPDLTTNLRSSHVTDDSSSQTRAQEKIEENKTLLPDVRTNSEMKEPAAQARPQSMGEGAEGIVPNVTTNSGSFPETDEPEAAPMSHTTVGHRDTLFEEAEECLSQSLLIFLLADLRLLSATGRINTSFETLAIDSDRAKRMNATQMAGLECELNPSNEVCHSVGISPAQIMATLLVELRKEVQEQRKKKPRGIFGAVGDGNESGRGGSLLNTLVEGNKQYEDQMHVLLRAYNSMIAQDLKTDIPKLWDNPFDTPLEKAASFLRRTSLRDQMNPLTHFSARNVSKLGPVNEDDEDQEPPDDSDKGKRRPRPRLQRSKSLHNHVRLMGSIIAQQIPTAAGHEAAAAHEFGNVGDALFKMGASPEGGSLRHSLKREVTEDQLLDMMENAVKSKVHSNLQFMADFFKKGSVSELMVKSTARITWFNDWYPLKDLTYAISVDQTRKRVLVVFRGAITRADWGHVFMAKLKKVENPVKDEYEGKSSLIRIHTGFHRYLFRKRKDTGTTKYDEITFKLHQYGSEEIGEDYKVVVTGMSLGGALTTMFGFFASTDERFTKNGPIQLFTYGSPYIGGYAFGDAFRHQENTRKLQHARFVNVRDQAAHLPVNFPLAQKKKKFRHVGTKILLPREPHTCCSCIKRRPTISYEGYRTQFEASVHAFQDFYFFHLPLLWNIRKVHSLNEHQKRLIYAKSVCNDGNVVGTLLDMSLEEIYESFIINKRANKK